MKRRGRAVKRVIGAVLTIVAAIAPPLGAQGVDLAALGDEAVGILQEYLRVNTINPPGNESRAVEFFARIFDAEGIAYESAESAPGRGNIWATIEGGDEPALILLHHSDVVPADPEHWDDDPLSGKLDDGFIYGRGALDTKGLGIMHLQAFLALHRSGIRPNRDVTFMATADEEAGGYYGAGWLIEHRPELFERVGLLLNEGGGGTVVAGQPQFGVEVTQKVPLWLNLVAVGQPGHGSRPLVASAVNRLIRALYNIQTYEFTPRILPAVDAYFKGVAEAADDFWRPHFANMAEAVRNRDLLLRLQIENPSFAALTRNACSITMLEGSSKINVVPPDASAQLDCRLLPDQSLDEFEDELRHIINDPTITIERIMGFSPAISSADTDLYRAIEGVVADRYPNARVVPLVQTGFTDSHFFRDLGITSYGFGPAITSPEESGGVHGNNERISADQVRIGTQMMYDIVREVVQPAIP